MNTIYIQYYQTRVGELIIGSYKEKLCLCDWRYRKSRLAIDHRIQQYLKGEYVHKETDIIQETKKQLGEYISCNRTSFDIPLLTIGSDFQKKVWAHLLNIPYGNTETYLSLSKQVSSEKAIRAVAAANGANAISIIIPCHRIIGSNGALTGYAGGLAAKQYLLELEGTFSNPDQLHLFDNQEVIIDQKELIDKAE